MSEDNTREQPGLAELAGLAQVLVEGAARAAREATYVAVGLGLLGANRVQARRRELQAWLAGWDAARPTAGRAGGTRSGAGRPALRLDELMAEAVHLVETARPALRLDELMAEAVRRVETASPGFRFDELVAEAVQLVETSLEPLQDRMPSNARDLAERAVTGALELGAQVRARLAPTT